MVGGGGAFNNGMSITGGGGEGYKLGLGAIGVENFNNEGEGGFLYLEYKPEYKTQVQNPSTKPKYKTQVQNPSTKPKYNLK